METIELKKPEEKKEAVKAPEVKERQDNQNPPKASDIVKRFKADQSGETKELDDLKKVNLDDIKDPQARSFVERRVKELESGINRKFEEIAAKRKELEAQLQEASKPWNKDRLKSLLRDQNFLASVQELQTEVAPSEFGGSQEQWSNLSPEEKREFENMRRENMSTRRQVQQLLQAQEDEKLKEKYPNYDPVVVDRLQEGLISGTVQATRDDLWKVANYEKDIERAYQLGLKDRNGDLSAKQAAGSGFQEVGNVKPANDLPDEVRKSGITAILKHRLLQAKRNS